jgi:hypothetical protein
MWMLPLSRREMVDLLGSGGPPPAIEKDDADFGSIRTDQMAAVWPARPDQFGRMPTVIVVPEGSHRDTLAWLVTYFRDFRPFTAFCRVVEWPVAEQFLGGPSVPNLHGVDNICAGLVLGEALAQSRGAATALDLPSTVYSATLSHAISRMIALTGSAVSLKPVTQSWMQARVLTGQNEPFVSSATIHGVWEIALSHLAGQPKQRTLFDSPGVCRMAWSDIVATGEISDQSWSKLAEGFPEIEEMRMLVKLPREQRLQSVELALHSLIRVRRDGEDRRSLLAGYFASLLAPGTLDHTDVLTPLASILPVSFMWYCLFAVTHLRGESVQLGIPMARRIIRDLTLPDRLIDRPRCDIALEEFAMSGSVAPSLGVTGKSGRLDVDLLPGVTTAVRWPMRQEADEGATRRTRDVELQHVAAEMQALTAHQRGLIERFRELLEPSSVNRRSPNQRKKKGGT